MKKTLFILLLLSSLFAANQQLACMESKKIVERKEPTDKELKDMCRLFSSKFGQPVVYANIFVFLDIDLEELRGLATYKNSPLFRIFQAVTRERPFEIILDDIVEDDIEEIEKMFGNEEQTKYYNFLHDNLKTIKNKKPNTYRVENWTFFIHINCKFFCNPSVVFQDVSTRLRKIAKNVNIATNVEELTLSAIYPKAVGQEDHPIININAIENFPNLKKLNIVSSYLSNEALWQLINASSKKLKILNLAGSYKLEVAETITKLRKNENISTIYIIKVKGSREKEQTTKVFFALLNKLVNLKTFHIKYDSSFCNLLGHVNLMPKDNNLEHLEIESCDNFTKTDLEFVLRNFLALNYLSIKRCKFDNQKLEEQNLPRHEKLRVFNIRGTLHYIKNKSDISIIFNAFPKLKTLFCIIKLKSFIPGCKDGSKNEENFVKLDKMFENKYHFEYRKYRICHVCTKK